ncbi:MAG: flap endonuclease-1 [Candidatus Aenigmatarchaeota archaeon]
MGVNLRELVEEVKVEIDDNALLNKWVAFDAFNILYQFLSVIRDKDTGMPLRDSKGRITSHISGLFYRTVNFIERGIKPVYVFDGEPPKFKKKEIEERLKAKEEAYKKWQEALEKGEEAITYAQAAAVLTKEMVEETKELLSYMGIPIVQAPSEGEAQAAYLASKGLVFASASQDYDSLLFGSPKLIRNLSIEGKRKLPRKEIYVEVKPELIELQKVLEKHKITREQLILIGLIVGTDYNEGIKGYGIKKALEAVKTYKNFETLKRHLKFKEDYIDEVYNFFLNPVVTDKVEIKIGEVQEEKILKFMVDERDFNEERVKNALEKLKEGFKKWKQTSLFSWFKK